MITKHFIMYRNLLLLGIVLSGPARAGSTLTLSDASSDETNPAMLNAHLSFDVSGNTLTLTAYNDTAGDVSFDLSAIYFNAPSSVDDIALLSAPPGWEILTLQHAGMFGTFDFALFSQLGNDPWEIHPGQSQEFLLEISGSDPLLDTDFTTNLSTIPTGNRPSLAAIKFINGPGDDSAFGAVVPEPSTLILLGFAACAAFARRRT